MNPFKLNRSNEDRGRVAQQKEGESDCEQRVESEGEVETESGGR